MAKREEVAKHHSGLLIILAVVAAVGLLMVLFNAPDRNVGGEAVKTADDCEPERTCIKWKWVNRTTSECALWGWVNSSVCIRYGWANDTSLVCLEWEDKAWECLEYKTVSVQDCRRYGYMKRC